MEITELKIGQVATIQSLKQVNKVYRHKLLAMGLTRFTPIRLVRYAPLGDPIEIEVRGVHLSVRKDEIKGMVLAQLLPPISNYDYDIKSWGVT